MKAMKRFSAWKIPWLWCSFIGDITSILILVFVSTMALGNGEVDLDLNDVGEEQATRICHGCEENATCGMSYHTVLLCTTCFERG